MDDEISVLTVKKYFQTSHMCCALLIKSLVAFPKGAYLFSSQAFQVAEIIIYCGRSSIIITIL